MSIQGKIYGRILISRVKESMKGQTAEGQGGFRSGRERGSGKGKKSKRRKNERQITKNS